MWNTLFNSCPYWHLWRQLYFNIIDLLGGCNSSFILCGLARIRSWTLWSCGQIHAEVVGGQTKWRIREAADWIYGPSQVVPCCKTFKKTFTLEISSSIWTVLVSSCQWLDNLHFILFLRVFIVPITLFFQYVCIVSSIVHIIYPYIHLFKQKVIGIFLPSTGGELSD